MNRHERSEVPGEYDIAYDGRTATWGHHVEWVRWLYQDQELFQYVGRYVGSLTPLPKPGQCFLLTMETGAITLHEVVSVDPFNDETNMFWCDAVMHGVVSQIEEADNASV